MYILDQLRNSVKGDCKKNVELITSSPLEDLQFHNYECIVYLANYLPETFKALFSTMEDWEPFHEPLSQIVGQEFTCLHTDCVKYQQYNVLNVSICFEFLIQDDRSNPFRQTLVNCAYRNMSAILAKYPHIYCCLSDEELFHVWCLTSKSDIIDYLRQSRDLKHLIQETIRISCRAGYPITQLYRILPLPEVEITLEMVTKITGVTFCNAVVETGKLGTCAGRSTDNQIIELIWEKIRNKDIGSYPFLADFYGYRLDLHNISYIRKSQVPKLFTRPWFDRSCEDCNEEILIRYLFLKEIFIGDMAIHAMSCLYKYLE